MQKFISVFIILGLLCCKSSLLVGQCTINASNLSPCGGTSVNFSVATPGNYSWDLDADNIIDVNGTSVNYQYPTANFDVPAAVVLYENGTPCDTLILTVLGVPDPTIDVVPGNAILDGNLIRVCSPTPESTLQIFNASNTISNNQTYTINWGDGTIENYDNTSFPNTSFISHDYLLYGYYNIIVFITGANGCVASHTYLFYNGSNPSVGLANPGNTVGLCAPATINFPITNTGNNPNGTEYFVYIGGEVVDSFLQGNVPAIYSYTFLESSCGLGTSTGNYSNAFDVQVVASNPCGSSQATIEPIEISTPPQAIFIVDQPSVGCVADVFTVSDASANVNEVISGNPSICESSLSPSWTISPGVPGIDWNLISGNVFNSNQIEIEFLTPGSYTITMTINSPACGSGSFSQTFTILEAPDAGATLDLNSAAAPSLPDECIPTLGTFLNQSTGDSISFNWVVDPPIGWNYGPTSGPTADNLELIFEEGGTYNVSLLVTNPCITDTWDTTFVIAAAPIATLSPIPDFCETALLNFDNSNVNVSANGGTISGYDWQFPGAIPASSNDPFPQNINYASPGTYMYSMTVDNQCGSTTVVDSFVIQQPGTLLIDNDYIVCQDEPAFQLFSNPGGGTWNGDGVTIGGLFTPGISNVGVNTLYYIYLDGACVLTDSLTVTVNPSPVVIAGESQSACEDDEPVIITGGTPVSGVWTSDNGGVITGTNAFDPVASGPGVYTLTYTFTDANGCTSQDDKTIVIYALPEIEAGEDQTICENPSDVQLTGFTPAGGTWTGQGVTPSGVFNTGNTPGPGSYTLYYTFTNSTTTCTNLDSLLMNVVPNDTADAGPDLVLCQNAAPLELLNGTPVGGIWTGFGVSSSTDVFDPSQVNPGVYTLTYTFGTGVCETSDEMEITVMALPVLTIPIDQILCINADTFDLSVATPLGGVWQGTGIQNEQFIPAQAGVGIHTLTYTFLDTTSQCSQSDSMEVEILPLPILQVTDTTICNTQGEVPLPATIPLGGTWSGPGLFNDNFFDPTLAGGSGQYILTYSFTDGEGCTNDTTATITVVEPEIVEAGPNDSICMDQGIITLANYLPLNGTWSGPGIIDSVNGLFDPAITGGGSHEIVYSYGVGNCLVQDSKIVYVIDLSNVFIGAPVSYCIYEEPIQLNAEGPPGGMWSGLGIIDSINGIFDPGIADTGVHIIVYTYIDPDIGCMASASKPITIYPMEEASFNMPVVTCKNSTLEFINTSNPSYTSHWDFGDRTSSIDFSPIHLFDSVGTYTIRLIMTNEFGCKDTTAQELLVTEAPLPIFALEEAEGCAPFEVSFTNQSSGFEVDFEWDFGNGETSQEVSPLPVIYGPGVNDTTYYVTLSVSNLCGSREYITPILVHPNPAAHFGATPQTVCSPLEVAFANISTGSATDFYWDFGNGTTSTDSMPGNQIFIADSADTNYTIMLIASNSCGTDTAYQEITVEPADVQAFFNVSDRLGCEPFTVDFYNFATPGATIGWEFGDGNGSDQAEPSHTFTEAGTYKIIQYASNQCGYDTSSLTITVLPAPEVSFSHNPFVCLGQEISFINESEEVAGSYWTFGDGDTSLLYSPTHVYDSAGIYTVTLTVTSQLNQCPSTQTSEVIVQALPVAAFEPEEPYGCAPFSTTFQNNSEEATFFVWNFGDGNTSIETSPSHTFTEEGTYVVSLIAMDANGCFNDTSLLNIQVYPVPVANFEFDRALLCGLPVAITFENNSEGADAYSWDFGDGNISLSNEPTFSYDTAGIFQIELIASNQFNCQDTALETIQTYAQPVADFEVGEFSGCSPLEVDFQNNSLYSDAFQWHFGGAGNTTEENPTLIFDSAATYSVQLIASIEEVCFDTLELENIIQVFPTPFANFSIEAPDPDFASGEYNFFNLSEDADTYLWDFGEGETSTEINPSYRYFVNGTRQVHLEASNQFGCVDDTLATFTPTFFKGLFVPSGFSPELGIGDVRLFKPVGIGLKEYHIQVFSPYGQLLWESTELKDGQPVEAWDGTHNGKLLPQDVYVWKATGIFDDGTAWGGQKNDKGKTKAVGSVILLR